VIQIVSMDESSRSSAPAWPRLLVLAPVAWWTLTLGSGAARWCFLDYVNLAFHEAGHLFLAFAGTTMHFLGGTLGQLAVPLALAARFLFFGERQTFGAALCLWWCGQSLINVSIYMADARELALPLVGGGDHDWNELFFRFGLLAEPSVRKIAGATHAAGLAVMLLGLAWACCLALPEPRRARVRLALAERVPAIGALLED
jgi:hypothetical protein